MRNHINPGLFGDVLEVPVPVVLEQYVASKNGGDEQVLGAGIVNIRKRSADTDPAGQSHTRFFGNVLEFATAHVLPKLVASNLIHKIDVVQPVAVNIRHGDATSMV